MELARFVFDLPPYDLFGALARDARVRILPMAAVADFRNCSISSHVS